MAPLESGTLDFAYDLTLDEARRRSAVLDAIGADWDPGAVLAEENRAWDLLYSGLDDAQQRIYDELVAAGVLPRRTAGDPASDGVLGDGVVSDDVAD